MSAPSPTGSAHEVAPDVFAVEAPFWGYALTQYLVRGSEWTAVDTGIATTPQEFVAPFLEEHGGIGALTLVLGTHGHVDHVGGNGAIKALNPEVRLTLPRADIGWAESATRQFLQLYKAAAPGTFDPDEEFESAILAVMGQVAAIDTPVGDGDTIPLPDGRSVEVRHVGAHSPGHVIFVDTDGDIAFIGDILQGRGSVNSASGLRAFPLYTPVDEYRRALGTLQELTVATFCTAHEGVIRDEAIPREIDAAFAWTGDFGVLLEGIVHELGPVTLAGIVDATLERWPGYERALQVHVTTLAHLDELVAAGRVAPLIENGVKVWASTD